MSCYIITFDLKDKSGVDYKAIYKIIEGFGPCVKIATTTCIVKTSKDANEMCDSLIDEFDKIDNYIYNDELFIAEVTKNADWFIHSDDVNSWLENNLQGSKK